MKRYQLHYYSDTEKTNIITISWEQGLHNFKIYHNKEIFYESKGASELNKGINLYHEKLGNVYIRLCTRPIGFEVKIGDMYIENSRILAQESLVTVAAIWFFIGVISTIGTIGLAMMDGIWYRTIGATIVSVLFVFSLFYFISGFLIRKGHIWAYYAAVGLFGAITILYFSNFVSMNLPIIIFRGIIIFIVLRHFKDMRNLYRHYRAKRSKTTLKHQEALLDA